MDRIQQSVGLRASLWESNGAAQLDGFAMAIEIRTIRDEEFVRWESAGAMAFGGYLPDDWPKISRPFTELDRAFGAFDGNRVVGTTTTRTATMTVPGGTARLGYVDDVSVLPTHRRRGIMTQMLRCQIDQMHERGEPLAGLNASEGTIYGRFGFGIATWAERWTIEKRRARFRSPSQSNGRVEFIEAEKAHAEWPRVLAGASLSRIGTVNYPAAYWAAALSDHEAQRRGGTPFFHVAHVNDGRISGLCTYLIRDRTVVVPYLVGEGAEIEAELWRYCFGIDLMSEIQAYNRPVDDPLLWSLDDPRTIQRTPHDQLWLRLVDVRSALARRTYREAGRMRVRVTDGFCPWNQGVYVLEGDPSGAECRLESQEPDIELGVSELASGYLGGVSFSTLARAGLIREISHGAIQTADRMFGTVMAPWMLEL